LTAFNLNQHLSYFRGRQAIRLSVRDRFGIVPEATKIEDMLCLLFGAPLPFVLRPVRDNFIIIGKYYIENFMQSKGLHYNVSDDFLLVRDFRYFTIL
jgi:hypothetical protein